MTTKSCLVSKLSHYVDLTAAESEMLAGLEEATQHHRRRERVLGRGEPMEDIFVVTAFTSTMRAGFPVSTDPGDFR